MKNEMLDKMLVKYEGPKEYQKLDGGKQKLLSFYYRSKNIKNKSNMLVVEDIVWESEFELFVNALREYNVNELVFASNWSSAIELLMYLIDNGYKVKETIIYEEDELFGKKEIKKGMVLVYE